MKKIIILLTLVAAVSAYSQGTVNFNTKVSSTPSIDAPIFYGGGGPATAGKVNGGGTGSFGGSTAYAALYGGPVGTTEANLVLLGSAVGFRSGVAAGYVNAGSVTISGVPAGASALVQLRVWDTGVAGSTWESLGSSWPVYFGKTGIIRIAALGSDSQTAANLVDADTGLAIQGFSIGWVPEPSILGLGLIGAVAGLLVFRRRK